MSVDDRKKQKGKAGKSLKDAMGLYGYMDRYKHIFIPSLFALYTTAALSLAFPYFLSKLIGKSMMAGGGSSDAAASKAMARIETRTGRGNDVMTTPWAVLWRL